MIFNYSDYISFLSKKVGSHGARTGHKQQLAKAMGCQQTYLSKVLNKQAHISLEQAIGAAEHFGFSSEETEYLLCLVSQARAGTNKLKNHYKQKTKALQLKMLAVENQVNVDEFLSPEQQRIYYSHWAYAGTHVAVALKQCTDVETVAKLLQLTRERAAEIVEYLLQTGLVVISKGQLVPGPTHIHLKKNSPDVIKNHTNWRLKALESISDSSPNDFHYTVVASLSKNDVNYFKGQLIEWVKEFLSKVETSKEETIYCQTIDFFRVEKD